MKHRVVCILYLPNVQLLWLWHSTKRNINLNCLIIQLPVLWFVIQLVLQYQSVDKLCG